MTYSSALPGCGNQLAQGRESAPKNVFSMDHFACLHLSLFICKRGMVSTSPLPLHPEVI